MNEKVKGVYFDDEQGGRLVLHTIVPPSNNGLYRNALKGRTLTPKAKEMKDEILNELMVAGAKRRAPKPPYTVRLLYRFPDARRRDVFNFDKLVVDALFEHLGVDDSTVYAATYLKFVDREKPGLWLDLRHTDRALEVE